MALLNQATPTEEAFENVVETGNDVDAGIETVAGQASDPGAEATTTPELNTKIPAEVQTSTDTPNPTVLYESTEYASFEPSEFVPSELLNPALFEGVTVYEDYDFEVPPTVLQLCEQIRSLGGIAFVVGGSVRDSVMRMEYDYYNEDPKDFDIEIYGVDQETVLSTLTNSFEGVKEKTFGAIDIPAPEPEIKEHYDITLARTEESTGVGSRNFQTYNTPTLTIQEASLRRDLKVNALLFDPLTKEVYDPFGGVESIKKRHLEITSIETFPEDPVRALRVAQFSSRLDFDIDPHAVDFCKGMVERGELDGLSKEKVSAEIEKIYEKGKKPSRGFDFLKEIGFIERYMPEMHALYDPNVGMSQPSLETLQKQVELGILPQDTEVPQHKDYHPEGGTWTHTLQCMDAMAQICDREGITSKKRTALVGGANSHDLGKPATAEFKIGSGAETKLAEPEDPDGTWRAHGHEDAGVEPTKQFLHTLNMSDKVNKMILSLVPEHMAPMDFYDAEMRGEDRTKALRRLSTRLEEGGTNLIELSYLMEADKRGRNPDSKEPLTREQVPEFVEFQNWLIKRANELGITESAPKKAIDGNKLIEMLLQKQQEGSLSVDKPIKKGPWMGVVINLIEEDADNGLFRGSQENSNGEGPKRFDPYEKAVQYYEKLVPLVEQVAQEEDVKEHLVWRNVATQEGLARYLADEV